MTQDQRRAWRRQLPLLDYLEHRGWKAVGDKRREEVAGLCPLHPETRPSFYVNRRKQVFFCHGCGQGGDAIRLIRLLEGSSWPQALARWRPSLGAAEAMEETFRFYQTQLPGCGPAHQFLASRGIRSSEVISRMRIGYAPGACLRGHLEQLGCDRQTLVDCGLTDARGRDCFFRCLTFPLPDAASLYGRSLEDHSWRHRFLPRSKGGLYGWAQARAFPSVIVVEGLLDLAALWQAGFDNTVAALGSHLNGAQFAQLATAGQQSVYLCLDADPGGRQAAHRLSARLRGSGVAVRRVLLPAGHDPNSFFAAGATAADFQAYLDGAQL